MQMTERMIEEFKGMDRETFDAAMMCSGTDPDDLIADVAKMRENARRINAAADSLESELVRLGLTPEPTETPDLQKSFCNAAGEAAERFADLATERGRDLARGRLRVRLSDQRFVTVLFGIGARTEDSDALAASAAPEPGTSEWSDVPPKENA